jgi:hypothetical protein
MSLFLECVISSFSFQARLAGRTVRKVVGESQDLVRSAVSKLKDLLVVTRRLKDKMPDPARAIIRRTFDSHVNRPLVGNAPVRKIVFREAEESISILTTIVNEVDWALCELLLRGNTLARIRRMLAHVSISNTNILARSLIVLNLYFDDKMFGQFALTDMIIQHMQHMSYVPDSVFVNKCGVAFVHRLAKPVYDTLKVLILNRNRQRSYIEAVMFHDWASLQQEAHIVDVTFRKDYGLDLNAPPYFSLHILFVTVELMDHFVTLGIELQLFCGHHELAGAYWYRDFLLSSLLNQISSMRRGKAEVKQIESEAAASNAPPRGKKKGKNQAKKPSNGMDEESKEDEFEFLLLGLKRGLCRGLVRVRFPDRFCKSHGLSAFFLSRTVVLFNESNFSLLRQRIKLGWSKQSTLSSRQMSRSFENGLRRSHPSSSPHRCAMTTLSKDQIFQKFRKTI